jgi:hypothetical protein
LEKVNVKRFEARSLEREKKNFFFAYIDNERERKKAMNSIAMNLGLQLKYKIIIHVFNFF